MVFEQRNFARVVVMSNAAVTVYTRCACEQQHTSSLLHCHLNATVSQRRLLSRNLPPRCSLCRGIVQTVGSIQQSRAQPTRSAHKKHTPHEPTKLALCLCAQDAISFPDRATDVSQHCPSSNEYLQGWCGRYDAVHSSGQ